MKARRFHCLSVNPRCQSIWRGSGDETSPLPFVRRGGMRIASPASMPEEERIPTVRPRRSRPILLVLSFLLLAGAGMWFWANHASDSAPDNQADAVHSTLHLDTFVLNLADNDQRSYLRIGIDLELNQEAQHAQETVPVAQVRDTILGVLGEARVSDLLKTGGKAELKQQVLHALQDRVPELGVKEVFFTEFLIQR
jgi:flagellar FliL protein